MHDMAFTFTYPFPRHDSTHYAPVTTHSPRQAIAPYPHPGYQHNSSQVQARPPVFQFGSNYSTVPGGQSVQSSSMHGDTFGVAHDPLPPPMHSNYQGTYMPNTHHRIQYNPQNSLHAATSHIPTTATTPPPLMIPTIATQPGEVSDIVATVTRESRRKGRSNCWMTFRSWALNEMKLWGKDQPELTYDQEKQYVATLWNYLPKDERLWWRRQTELLHARKQEKGVPPTGGSAAAPKLREFSGSVDAPPATEGPSRKKPKRTHTASRATAAQPEPAMASTSSGRPRRSVARPKHTPDREELRRIRLAVQQHTVVFAALPTGEHSSLGASASAPSAVGSFVQDASASLSLVWASSPPPSHRSRTDGRSLLDASAPPMGEPFAQVASASVSPIGASSPPDSHASATHDCPDASAAPTTEAYPSDAQHAVSSVDDIPWRAHHTWPFGPQGHTALPPAQAPSSGPDSEETHTLWDAHPAFLEDYNFDFTHPFGSADYAPLVPGPSTAEILSKLTTRLDPSVLSSYSTLEFALGH